MNNYSKQMSGVHGSRLLLGKAENQGSKEKEISSVVNVPKTSTITGMNTEVAKTSLQGGLMVF